MLTKIIVQELHCILKLLKIPQGDHYVPITYMFGPHSILLALTALLDSRRATFSRRYAFKSQKRTLVRQ